MQGFSLQRLHSLGVATSLAGILALAAIALRLSPLLTVGTISVATLCGALVVWHTHKLNRRIEHASGALGAFIRGSFDARIINIHGLDALGKLQHRINNVLDIVDIAVRQNDAAVDTGDDEAYVNRISASNLYAALYDHMEQVPVLEMPAQLNVSPMLAQLEQLRQSVGQLQTASRDLLARADLPKSTQGRDTKKLSMSIQKTVEHARGSPLTVKTLHQAAEKIVSATTVLDRLAERGEILALNMAISAAHAGGDERINAAVSSVRLLADQTREAKDAIAGTTAEMYAAAHSAMRMIYDIANLIHQVNEAFSMIQRAEEISADTAHDSHHLSFISGARQALAAADELHGQATRLDEELKQLSEAA